MAASDEQQKPDRYLVSARKYRPQIFADVVAQEHVAATLRNALRFDRLAHAYLFSGPRGVGKTTVARLLAKAINCQTPLEERAEAEPCRACTSCRAFEEGRDLNVIEIDAASNRRIEDVRDLRETIRIPPQGARMKVYILDEIHMLTKEAFNALLKTLEEPPPHALFIFATTEPHKVLPTILSRCQRFDFRRIPVEETVAHLREIGQQEGITADDGALHLIAMKGDGALRDALSLFDQAVALCGRDLRHDDLAEALGVVDRDLFFAATEAARSRDSAALLRIVERVLERGYDLAEFLSGLVEHLRNLYVVKATGDADLVESDAATRSRYLAAADGTAEADLMRSMMVVDEAERRLRTSPQPRLTVELALLRLAHLEPVQDLKTLIARLEQMEKGLPPGEGLPAGDVLPAGDEPARPKREPATAGVPGPAAKPTGARPGKAQSEERPPPSEPPQRGSSDDGGLPSGPPPSAPPSPAGEASRRPAETTTSEVFGRPALKRRSRLDNGGPAGSGGEAVQTAEIEATDLGPELGRVREAWPRLVELVRHQSNSVATLLERSAAANVRAGAVTITVPDNFSRDVLRRERKVFVEALREALGGDPPAFTLEVQAGGDETAQDEDPFETIKRLRTEHPTLRLLFERFGAEIVWT